jgi:hypothetical protein
MIFMIIIIYCCLRFQPMLTSMRAIGFDDAQVVVVDGDPDLDADTGATFPGVGILSSTVGKPAILPANIEVKYSFFMFENEPLGRLLLQFKNTGSSAVSS